MLRRVANAHSVMIALFVSGIGSYAFLAGASRSLVPEAYGRLVGAWVVVRVLEPALFAPLAHVMARNLAAGRVRYDRNELNWASLLGIAVLLALGACALALRQPVENALFDGDVKLYLVVLAALPARLAVTLACGFSVGRLRFSTYGRLYAVEGLVLMGWSAALVMTGAGTPVVFACALLVGPIVAIWWNRAALRPPRADPGGNAGREVNGRAVVHQMVSTSLAMAMLSLGPIVVKALADPGQAGEAGRLQNAMSVSQAPLLVLNAVFVTLMPQLTKAVVAHDRPGFIRRTARTLLFHAAGSVLAVGLGGVFGPPVVRLAYGGDYLVSSAQFEVLVAAAALYFGSQIVSQAFLALGCTLRTSASHLAGGIAMATTVAVTDGLLTRVAVAVLVGTAVTYVVSLVLLAERLASWASAPGTASAQLVSPPGRGGRILALRR